jgi:hypothetical protein
VAGCVTERRRTHRCRRWLALRRRLFVPAAALCRRGRERERECECERECERECKCELKLEFELELEFERER